MGSERKYERIWSCILWAVVGFGIGTGMVAPLVLAIDAKDRVVGGMLYGGIPLAVAGVAFGLHRARR